MVKYDSPIGSKQSTSAQMKDFSVSDESGYTPPPPPQHRHIREERPPPFDPNAMREFQESMRPQRPPQMKELTDVEHQIFAAKKAKREGKERLSDGAKRRIELLVGMTRLTKDVDIDGKLYRLQTLKSKELRDALVATAEFDGTIQLVFETRKQLLARSLTVVAGVDVEQFLNSSELEDRQDFIEELDHSLLLRLYNEYLSLSNEAQDKYALKTEEQAKEVLEDLKK